MAMNTTASLKIYKEVYKTGDVTNLVPDVALLAARIPFSQQDAIGNKYNMPMRVKYEHSIVYSAAGTTPTWSAGSYTSGAIVNAQIDGSQILGRAALDYEAIAKGNNGEKASFIKATSGVLEGLASSMAKRREISLLHGRKGWGTIESTSGSDIVITAASWSNAIWSGMLDMQLDCYASNGTTARTNSATDAITAINTATRTITLGNSVDASWVAGDLLFPVSCSGATDFAGIDATATATASSGLYGLSGYELVAGNIIDTATGTPSMSKLLNACGVLSGFGIRGNIICVLPTKAFEYVNADQSALRAYPKATKDGVNGFGNLVFNCQAGTLELLPHPMQKDGLIHFFVEGQSSRIGATDLNFIRRHGTEEVLTLEISDSAGAEMRCYGHQAYFAEKPRGVAVLQGVTY